MRVLVAAGDRGVVSWLKRALTADGYTVDVALNGEHGLWHAVEFDYDAVLLDGSLPGLDGMEVAIRLNERKPATPILMLVAPDEAGDYEHRLRAVADGYLTKPVGLDELTAQLRALIGTRADPRPHDLCVGDLRLSPATRQAWRGDSELNLSPREFALLQLFLAHPGQVLSRRQILDWVWARDHDKAPNLVDQYVLYLRRKMDRPFAVQQLETVRGKGYRLRERPTTDPAPRFLGLGSDPPRSVGR